VNFLFCDFIKAITKNEILMAASSIYHIVFVQNVPFMCLLCRKIEPHIRRVKQSENLPSRASAQLHQAGAILCNDLYKGAILYTSNILIHIKKLVYKNSLRRINAMHYYNDDNSRSAQLHVHEIGGSVKAAKRMSDPHNHRFAAVSAEARSTSGGDHVHDVQFRTDNYENHYHEFYGTTGGAIKTGGRHVHFLKSVTSVSEGHFHVFELATLIEDPTADTLG
jgi:hypothetical protein